MLYQIIPCLLREEGPNFHPGPLLKAWNFYTRFQWWAHEPFVKWVIDSPSSESDPNNKTSEHQSSPGPPVVIHPMLPTHTPPRPSTPPHNLTPLTLTPVPPTQFGTDIANTSMPPRDVWLGVALGLLGVGGFICGGYYVLKEYRRRMRIRRFLQYR